MQFAQSLLTGNAELTRMREEIFTVLHLVCELVGNNENMPTYGLSHKFIFNDHAWEFFVGKEGRESGRIKCFTVAEDPEKARCRLVFGAFGGSFTSLRHEDVVFIHSQLERFVIEVKDRVPWLLTRMQPFFEAADRASTRNGTKRK